MDTASLTSVNLLRCLLSEFHHLLPQFIPSDSCADPEMPRLLIGNQAIDFRRNNETGWNYLDLGLEWSRQTSLPFVYALWLINPRVENAPEIARELREIKQAGIGRLPEICREDMEFRQHYLRECIRYDLNGAEKSGMRRFGALLEKQGLIEFVHSEFSFV
jgi:chorismate dehydratase